MDIMDSMESDFLEIRACFFAISSCPAKHPGKSSTSGKVG